MNSLYYQYYPLPARIPEAIIKKKSTSTMTIKMRKDESKRKIHGKYINKEDCLPSPTYLLF